MSHPGVPHAAANHAALERCWPALHARVSAHHSQAEALSLIAAGEPWPGVESHLDTVPPGAQGLVVFLGLGLGYGPLLLLRARPEVRQIVILEPSLDVFSAALAAVDLQPLLEAKHVHLFVGEIDWEQMEEAVTRVASLEDTHILRHLPSFQRQPDLYGPINDRAYMILNHLNASGSTTRTCGPIFMDNRLSILTLLRHSHSLDALRGRFAGKPAILVAAGPSLTKSIPDLRRAVGSCVLIAADSALAPLLKAGITPDFVTSIDYLDLNFEKLAPFLREDWPFSLVTTVKATPLISQRFPARHIFLAFADDQPQQWMIEALGVKTMAAIASSVAHMSLGLALILGCEPIIFIGQDLSYTNAIGDHAEGTVIMRDDMPKDREFFQRPAVGGGTVTTDRQLLSLLKIFEDIIAAAPRHYINATAAGLRIQGAAEMTLADAITCHCRDIVPVAADIAAATAAGPSFDVEQFLRVSKVNLATVKATQRKLSEVIALTQDVAREVAKLPARREIYGHFSSMPAGLQKKLARFDRMNAAIDSHESTWTQVLELTFGMLSDNDQRLAQNQRLRERTGYLPWLSAELARIQALNQDRLAVLNRYAGSLSRLIGHLDREKQLLAGTPPGARHLELIQLHLQAGNYALVKRLLTARTQPDGNDPQFLLSAGEVQAGMLNYPAALRDWRQAIVMEPSLAPSVQVSKQRFCEEWLGFVERYGNAGEEGDNFPHLLPAWLGRVKDITSQEGMVPPRLQHIWDVHRSRCEEWLSTGHCEPAELTLNGWQVLSDCIPEVLIVLARLLAHKGKADEAIAATEKALRIRPDQPEWLAQLVRQLLQAHHFDDAIAMLGKAVQLDPKHGLIWEEIGDLLCRDKDYSNALLAYEKCYLALPQHGNALCRMGDCYLATHQTEAAIAAYEAALKQGPANASALLGLSKAKQLASAAPC